MTWSKGQPWRVARSLDRLAEQIRAAYPRAAPPATPAASWGSIADSAHSSTSDHYPHYYSALGKTAVVCARDFPHAPTLGLDAHALAEQLRLSRDPRIGYIISNRRITGPAHGWRWDRYSGSDPHDTHIHTSSVHTAAADDTRPWQIQTGEDDMSLTKDDIPIIREALHGCQIGRSGVTFGQVFDLMRGVPGQVTAVRADVAALAGRDLVDEQQVAAQLAPAVLAALTPQAIAGAIPPELARQVADELAARLAG